MELLRGICILWVLIHISNTLMAVRCIMLLIFILKVKMKKRGRILEQPKSKWLFHDAERRGAMEKILSHNTAWLLENIFWWQSKRENWGVDWWHPGSSYKVQTSRTVWEGDPRCQRFIISLGRFLLTLGRQ